jgi:hypothetical protein
MLLGKNHRHTGMDLRDELIGFACDNRASADVEISSFVSALSP